MNNTNTLHSPKARYYMTIDFVKPQKGIGSSVSYSSDDVKELQTIAATMYTAPRKVTIRENVAVYPSFDWQVINSYRID